MLQHAGKLPSGGADGAQVGLLLSARPRLGHVTGSSADAHHAAKDDHGAADGAAAAGRRALRGGDGPSYHGPQSRVALGGEKVEGRGVAGRVDVDEADGRGAAVPPPAPAAAAPAAAAAAAAAAVAAATAASATGGGGGGRRRRRSRGGGRALSVAASSASAGVGSGPEEELVPLVRLDAGGDLRVDGAAEAEGELLGPTACLLDLPQALEEQLLQPPRRDPVLVLERPPVHETLQPRRRHPGPDVVGEPAVHTPQLRRRPVQAAAVQLVPLIEQRQLAVRRALDHLDGVLQGPPRRLLLRDRRRRPAGLWSTIGVIAPALVLAVAPVVAATAATTTRTTTTTTTTTTRTTVLPPSVTFPGRPDEAGVQKKALFHAHPRILEARDRVRADPAPAVRGASRRSGRCGRRTTTSSAAATHRGRITTKLAKS